MNECPDRSAAKLPADRPAAVGAVRPHPPLSFDDGAISSTLYGDVFKRNLASAIDEARAVFVDGADLAQCWAGRRRYTVIEIGFGLGASFLATLLRWRDDPQRSERLVFVSLERHPVTQQDLRRALVALAAPADLASALVAQWPPAVPGVHRLAFEGGRVTLLLGLGDAATLLPRLSVRADAVFLDGFAPARNPDAWSEALLRQLARVCVPGAQLATYTSAAVVRRSLQAAGFDVQRVPGFGGKFERMLAIRRADARAGTAMRIRSAAAQAMQAQVLARTRESTIEAASTADASKPAGAIVVGAGLAGCTIAAALVARGWQVTLIEAGAAPLPEDSGSAQPLLAEHLHLSPDDNPLARLTRSAWSLACTASPATRATRRAIGRLLGAGDEAGRDLLRATVDRLGWPADFVRWAAADDVRLRSGVDMLTQAIWWPGGAIVDPRERCAALLAEARHRLAWIGGCTIGAIVAATDDDHHAVGKVGVATADAGLSLGTDQAMPATGWRVYDTQSRLRASAEVLILANAGAAPPLAGVESVRLQALRGQSSRIRSDALVGLRCAIGGDAYVLPFGDGSVLTNAAPDDDALTIAQYGGWRYAARDHLPVIGPVHDEATMQRAPLPWQRNDRLAWPMRDGLYLACGFGSRGLLWSTLAAELLAAMIDGDPLPLEKDLVAAISPGRFLRRALRRGQWV